MDDQDMMTSIAGNPDYMEDEEDDEGGENVYDSVEMGEIKEKNYRNFDVEED
jgi:hypothetical protein